MRRIATCTTALWPPIRLMRQNQFPTPVPARNERYFAPPPRVVYSFGRLLCYRGADHPPPEGRGWISRRRRSFSRTGVADFSTGLAPALMLAIYQPDIPQNTGTMLRLCACLGIEASIIEPAGFPVSDRAFRRAGMDYLDAVALTRHVSWTAFEAWRAASSRRLVLLTTAATQVYTDFAFGPGDIVLVGRESSGAPDVVHAAAEARLAIPVRPGLRSLNVAVAAAMVLGEAVRQLDSNRRNSG